jgi:hypothetical protein
MNASFRRNLSLYPFQEETVAHLIEEESRNRGVLQNHVSVTEPYGSGKTFIILSFIMRVPIAPIRETFIYSSRELFSFAPTSDNQVIRPTAIVVARSVFAQWMHNIKQFTSLRVFEVRDVLCCDKMIRDAKNGDLNDYDIVLIKYGKSCGIGGEEGAEHLCSRINRKTMPLMWSRVVYDDADSIVKCPGMRACSSVFVSGNVNFNYSPIQMRAMVDFDRHSLAVRNWDVDRMLIVLPNISHIGRSDAQHTARNALKPIWQLNGHSTARIETEQRIFAIYWHMVSITRRDIIRAGILMRDLVGDQARLIEMIHNDAFAEAAQLLHIEAATPDSLFAAVLGMQRHDYETLQARLKCCEMMRDHKESERKSILPKELRTIAKRRVTIDMRDDVSLDTEDAIRAMIARIERSFERISENIRDQTCSICFDDIAQNNTVIMRCCGFVVCLECCMRAARFHPTGRDNHIIGTCPQCRVDVDIARDLILISSGTRATDLVSRAISGAHSAADSRAEAPAAASSSVAEAHKDDEYSAPRNKIEYILQYIRGLVPNGDYVSPTTRIEITPECPNIPNIEGLLMGNILAEGPRFSREHDERKIIICCSYDSNIDEIAQQLTKDGISHASLRGSQYEYANILREFTQPNAPFNVLLLNVTNVWSGVDLQCATDIIITCPQFSQYIGQMIGRAQRIGRACSLRVHMLEYTGVA